VFERAADGRETPWGTVLAYDPPHRLAFSWIVELSAEQEQLVEIRFTAEDRGTRVELTHSGKNSETPQRACANATTAVGAPSSSAISSSTSIPLQCEERRKP
jgi:uncharacterized protein YndB with AHSA1/START domain